MLHSETAVVFLQDVSEARDARISLERSNWKAVVIKEPIPIAGRLIIIDEKLLPALHEKAVTLLPGGRIVIAADNAAGKASGPMTPEVYMLYRPYTATQMDMACQVN